MGATGVGMASMQIHVYTSLHGEQRMLEEPKCNYTNAYTVNVFIRGVSIFVVFVDSLIHAIKNALKYIYYTSFHSRLITFTKLRTNKYVIFHQTTEINALENKSVYSIPGGEGLVDE
jgi:hypothetical protein